MPVPKSGHAEAIRQQHIEAICELVHDSALSIARGTYHAVVDHMLNLNAFSPLDSRQIYQELNNPNSRTGARIKASIQKRAVSQEQLERLLNKLVQARSERRRQAKIRKYLKAEEYYFEKTLKAALEGQEAARDSLEEIQEINDSWQQFNQMMTQMQALQQQPPPMYEEAVSDYLEAELDLAWLLESVELLDHKIEHRKDRFYQELQTFHEIIESKHAQAHLDDNEQSQYQVISDAYRVKLSELERLMQDAADGKPLDGQSVEQCMAELRSCYESRRQLLRQHVERLSAEHDPALTAHCELLENAILQKDDKFNHATTRVQQKILKLHHKGCEKVSKTEAVVQCTARRDATHQHCNQVYEHHVEFVMQRAQVNVAKDCSDIQFMLSASRRHDQTQHKATHQQASHTNNNNTHPTPHNPRR